LEDAVNDAPRAPEFLGRIFAKVVTENVIPLREIGMLIHAGGEEPGRLRDLGLAADVLGSILEMIKSEKGDSVLSEIRTSSNLRLEDFRPLDPNRSRKLENFI
jgi:translation initiation factor 4G